MTIAVRTTGFPASNFEAATQDEPGGRTLARAILVDQLAAALNLPYETDPVRQAHVSSGPVALSLPDRPWQPDIGFNDHAELDTLDDLPRLFARTTASTKQQPQPSAFTRTATRRYPRSDRTLSGRTVALGFAIGLAVAGPVTWVAASQTHVRQNASLPDSGHPSALVSTLASLDGADGIAAFDEASRRIARGDYIGARDLLRRAVTAGEDRARMLLNALD
jgi:hypothetical protein